MNKICLLTIMAASMCFASRIGVLKGENACPGESVIIQLNTEDHNPRTYIGLQQIGQHGVGEHLPIPGVFISDDKSEITFKYCVFDVPTFNNFHYNASFFYAVLLLDDTCPTGSYKVKRHHDTEDHGDNHSWGNTYPNVIGHNADLYYCLVPKKSCSNPSDCDVAPKFGTNGYEFGFLALAPDYTAISNDGAYTYTLFESIILIDDEDSRNENSWNYYGLSSYYKSAFDLLVWDSSNDDTFMSIAYPHRQQNNPYLSKSVEEGSSFMPVDAKQLSAPMVKGLDRSAIAVELKSAGDVRITVANVKGAVVANIVEKNLQAGVHQVKWNSGIVPNGRYIVTVKQNDMVNAKNVILK